MRAVGLYDSAARSATTLARASRKGMPTGGRIDTTDLGTRCLSLRMCAERSRSPAGASNASAGPVDCGVRPPAPTVGREFLSHYLPDDVERRAPVNVLQ